MVILAVSLTRSNDKEGILVAKKERLFVLRYLKSIPTFSPKKAKKMKYSIYCIVYYFVLKSTEYHKYAWDIPNGYALNG